MAAKFKVLAWSDCVFAPTGFGTVSHHVLAGLHQTGRYQIDQLAINYHGEFYDSAKYPYQLSPARLLDPADPYGNKQLVRALRDGDYDILWIVNDPEVVHDAATHLARLKSQKQAKGQKVFKTIYYFPVDCTIRPEVSAMIAYADAAVTYTHWAQRITQQKMPELKKSLGVIYHGADPENFRPLGAEAKQQIRANHLRVSDPQTFLIINVNRNLPRKDLARSILAFSEFRKHVGNSMLYLHCPPRDKEIDLIQCCKVLGLNNSTDVLFPGPKTFAEGGGLPLEALNRVYNAGDALLTTTLGEGWGLTLTEAMCAGIPVVAPNNSSIPEILGEDGNRGYVYDCKDLISVDTSGYRPTGRIEDIVAKMLACYNERAKVSQQAMLRRAGDFVRQHSWANTCRQWIDLFDRVSSSSGS